MLKESPCLGIGWWAMNLPVADVNSPGSQFQQMKVLCLQRRAVLILVVQSLGLLDALCHLEEQVSAAVESQVVYSFPWKWGAASGMPAPLIPVTVVTRRVQREYLIISPCILFGVA